MKRAKDRTSITPQLETRVKRLKNKARDYITKSETVQFRLDQDSFEKLFAIAKQERKPVGTLVRQWVSDKVNQHKSSDVRSTVVYDMVGLNHAELAKHLGESSPIYIVASTASGQKDKAYMQRFQDLQEQIDKLKTILDSRPK